LTFDKLLVLGVLAVLLLGPERLPRYAAQFARMIRSLRRLADDAKDRMREEMGPDFDEVDWKRLDPRQYDPRRIIREALLDDADDQPMPKAVGRSAQSASEEFAGLQAQQLPVPFDDEAT
jgi:sec-independent protein translocase protein TatB